MATATAYGKVQKGTGYEVPEIEDDLYVAQIADVQDSTGKWEGVEYPQYMVKFDLVEQFNEKGDPVQLAGFIRVPDGVVNDGVLNENAKLYEFLTALGYTADDMEIDPAAWQGQQLRIVVENKEIKSGDNKGQVRPRITGYKPMKKATAKLAAPAKRTTKPADDSDDF